MCCHWCGLVGIASTKLGACGRHCRKSRTDHPYSISAVDDDVAQCWVTEPEDMQEIWKALETSKVTFVPKSAKSVTYDGDQIMYHLRIYEGEKPVAELGFLDDGRVLGDTWEYRYKGENPAAWTQMLKGLLEKYTN